MATADDGIPRAEIASAASQRTAEASDEESAVAGSAMEANTMLGGMVEESRRDRRTPRMIAITTNKPAQAIFLQLRVRRERFCLDAEESSLMATVVTETPVKASSSTTCSRRVSDDVAPP